MMSKSAESYSRPKASIIKAITHIVIERAIIGCPPQRKCMSN